LFDRFSYDRMGVHEERLSRHGTGVRFWTQAEENSVSEEGIRSARFTVERAL